MIARSIALAGAVLCAGCAPARTADGTGSGAGVGNAIVIPDESLEISRGSLLTIMQDHVRGMRVARTDECPHVVLRGGVGRSQAAEVLVYLDGQRMSDTCILEGLNIESIGHIEVYPGGVTQRPGYTSNSGGLILVFMKSGPAQRRGPI